MAESNLPGARRRLVGRQNDLAALRDLILHGDRRLVTVTGMPGAGKTSLALAVLRELQPDLADGVWCVSLESASTNADLASLCAAALNLGGSGEDHPADRLEIYLQPRQALLLLDNCEHVSAACAVLVDSLLRNCPDLRILATSRIPLRLAGEARYRVEPLPIPDPAHLPSLAELAEIPAVELFLSNARAVRHTFQLTVQNSRAVAQICSRLEGLPLAIELAAARVDAFAPDEIAQRIGAPPFVDSVATISSNPHQGLEAALDWSYELLSSREQQLFRRLAALPADWTARFAEDISEEIEGEPGGVADALAVLVEHSLIVAGDGDAAGRYHALVPVREYAKRCLQDVGELEPTFRAYARTCQKFAERMMGSPLESAPPPPETLDAMDREHEGFLAAASCAEEVGDARTALRLTLSLWMYWRVRGHVRVGLRQAEAALNIAPGAHLPLRGGVLIAAAYFNSLIGRHSRAIKRADEALKIFRDAKMVEGQGAALGTLGDVFVELNDLPRARAVYEDALALVNPATAPLALAWGLTSLGSVALLQQRNDEARRMLERASALLDKLGASGWHKGRTLSALAQCYRRSDEHEHATAVLREAVGHLRLHGVPVETIRCLEELGQIAGESGQPARAAVLLGAATALHEATGATLLGAPALFSGTDLDDLRSVLGESRFAAAWNSGRSMSLDQAAEAAIAEGEPLLDGAATSPLDVLTPREREVAELLADDLTNAGIAERLVISDGTVRTHVERILRKLGCRSRLSVATLVTRARLSE